MHSVEFNGSPIVPIVDISKCRVLTPSKDKIKYSAMKPTMQRLFSQVTPESPEDDYRGSDEDEES